jgi:hypothetical protein
MAIKCKNDKHEPIQMYTQKTGFKPELGAVRLYVSLLLGTI